MEWWYAFAALRALLLGNLVLSQAPKPITVSLYGESMQHVAADRATLALRVLCEGANQAKVAACVQRETEAIMELLRPLTQPPAHAKGRKLSQADDAFAPPIATLAVDAFSADSWSRTSFLSDATVYKSAVSVKAEFRAMKPELAEAGGIASGGGATDQTVMPGVAFRYLSLVLPSLSRLPATKIESLRWFLAPATLAAHETHGRRAAMAQMRRKIDDYTAPLRLRWPTVHCRSFSETQRSMPYDVRLDDFDHVARAPRGVRMYTAHDEMDSASSAHSHGYAVEENRAEAFGMEPKSISIVNRVDGNWKIVDRGPVRTLIGYLT